MAILRLRIEYEQVGIGRQMKVELLALPVSGDVDLNFARRESPTIGDEWPEFAPRPQLSEFLLNGFKLPVSKDREQASAVRARAQVEWFFCMRLESRMRFFHS
jgi:hypothetical protein